MDAQDGSKRKMTPTTVLGVEIGDIRAFCSQMQFTCNRLGSRSVSAEEIRDTWEPQAARPSAGELNEYLAAAVENKDVVFHDELYQFAPKSEYFVPESVPSDRRNSALKGGFSADRGVRDTKHYLGTGSKRQ